LLPITGLAGDMEGIRQVLNDEQWAQLHAPTAAEMPAGSAVFHHPLTVHGSEENRSNRPRRAIVLNVVRDGTCSDSNEPLLAGVPPIAQGEALSGQYFPLLFDPDRMLP
jgi:ectoine hydroxylase-related dioxygenase (phytanoyl-CoA dioxygenase family)